VSERDGKGMGPEPPRRIMRETLHNAALIPLTEQDSVKRTRGVRSGSSAECVTTLRKIAKTGKQTIGGIMRTWRMTFSTASVAALCSAALTCVLASSASASSATASISRIPLAGTGVPQTRTYIPPNNSDFAQPEFQPQLDSQASPGTYQGVIVNRSLSDSSGSGVSERTHVELSAGRQFGTGFEGLNFFNQRYANGGNQFSVEPPDQGLCVGNGYVVEAVNDVFNVYGATGQSLLSPNNVGGAVDLNSFFGYPAQFNRTTGDQGPSVTDPSCLYDSGQINRNSGRLA
jgi:hypothetical protein